MPVTTPVPETDTLLLLTLHVPPVAASARVMVLPGQTKAGPVIVPASVPTDIGYFAVATLHPLFTV